MRLWRNLTRIFPLALVLGVGVGLATIPHWRTRDSEWISDYDELAFYLPVGADAYREHPWRLTDPVTGGPTYYQPLSIVPCILLAKALDLSPWRLGLCWRVLGGLMVGTAWYILLALRFRPWVSSAVACILMADPGVLNGQLGYSLAKNIARPPSLAAPMVTPTGASLPQWRILNPTLCWPWWLAFIALTVRAVAVPTWWRVLAAGFACGLLFYVYFYLWTAAVAGLMLAVAVDRRRWRVYIGTLAIGAAIGLPAVLGSAQFRAEHGSDWLLRTDKFLPVGRFDELLIPRVSLALLVIAWVWVWWRGRNWAWLAAIATAALLLLNQTAITGLQIENFHWNFALGPALSLLVVLVAGDLFGQLPTNATRFGPALVGILACLVVAGGAWLSARAATGIPENAQIRVAAAAFRSQVGELRLADGAVAGDADFQYLAAVGFNLRPLAGYSAVLSPITDDELDVRVALNARLRGWSRELFRTNQESELRQQRWGPEARSEDARATRLTARLAAWDAVASDTSAVIDRFDVRVVALLAGTADSPPAGWVLAQRGPRWAVWARPR
jgi:hypothetical protein